MSENNPPEKVLLSIEVIERRIYFIRGHKVMFDATWLNSMVWTLRR